LWPLTNEALANTVFEQIEEIEQAELVVGLTNYHWWPQVA
jgi:hypothetical protein